MGNSSSASSSSIDSQDENSGVYLNKNLQAKIQSDFESMILQSEWDNYRASFLRRHNQREIDYALHQTETSAKLEKLRSDLAREKLNETISNAERKISDLILEVNYDVDRVTRKFEAGIHLTERVCLDPRAKLSHCYNILKDSRECQIFARKLEQCVTKAMSGEGMNNT